MIYFKSENKRVIDYSFMFRNNVEIRNIGKHIFFLDICYFKNTYRIDVGHKDGNRLLLYRYSLYRCLISNVEHLNSGGPGHVESFCDVYRYIY